FTEALRRSCLEVIGNKMLNTCEELHKYLQCTFAAQSQLHNFTIAECQTILEQLCSDSQLSKKLLVSITEDGVKKFSPSSYGSGVFSSSLQPSEAVQLFHELRDAMNGLVLHCDLHLVYHVIPISDASTKTIDWSKFKD